MSIGLSVCEHISGTASLYFTRFPVHVVRGRNSAVALQYVLYNCNVTTVRLMFSPYWFYVLILYVSLD